MRMSFVLSVALTALLVSSLPTAADIIVPYNEYSGSPTIGRGHGTSTDPRNPGYGAMRIFIQKVVDYTDALPAGQKVLFQRDQKTGREVNALRAGVQFANKSAQPHPTVSDPSWGFIYNSVPFGMNFEQMLKFLYDAKLDEAGRNGIALAQAMLDSRGGTQIVIPVLGSTMQGSGYFPRPTTATRETPNVKNRALESAWRAFARRAGEFATCPRPKIS
jgi:hypothetical protein